MNKIYSILEGLQDNIINESINTSLLDRFVLYCRKSNLKDATIIDIDGRYYMVGISLKRMESMTKSFAKSNNLIFEYECKPGCSIEITKLQTKISI
jgi:hypothetical protein